MQVEVSSYCNAACIYCPHTVYRDIWLSRHLSLETFKRLKPAFAKTLMVYLQGWGEPLLHPDFFEMASMAKTAGCSVGATTNGMFVDRETILRLISSEVAVVAFSLAGVDERNDSIRVGTKLEEILGSIKALDRAKKERCVSRPAIHIAYLLLRSGLKDIEALPALLHELGVAQAVISTLDFVPAGKFEEESLFVSDDEEYEAGRSLLDAVVASGERQGVRIHYHLPFRGTPRQTCTENVKQALFVSADGNASSCVYTGIPASKVSYMVRGVQRPYQRLTFGNVNERSLSAIWREKTYATFRKSFYAGGLSLVCQDCPKLYMGHRRTGDFGMND